MENYKIKVENEAESKEAQELFEQLGYKLVECHRVGMVAVNDGEIYPDVIGNWDEYNGKELTLPQLRDLVAQSKNEQGLISGADALIAIGKGERVQYSFDDDKFWQNDIANLKIADFGSGHYEFRLKPRTIKLSLEIPAPFEPKRGETAFLLTNDRFGYMEIEYQGHSTTLGAWRTEEEIKQVVAALRGGIKG